MVPWVTDARYLGEYRLEVTFDDGVTGEIDLRNEIVGQGGILEPLENLDFFRRVMVNPEVGTLVWPNDVDLCPTVLYSLATKKPLPARSRS